MNLPTDIATNKNATEKRVALFVVALGSAQSALTLSSIQIAIPDIAREMQASAIQISWIPMAFLLVNAIFILPIGRYADAVGRKRIFLFGLGLFGLANLLAALAESMHWLLVCRGLQGLATAMLHATGMAIISSIYPAKQRAAALGIAASAIYFGLSLGPVVGGFLTEYAGWRSAFAVQVPISVVCVILVLRYLPGEWQSKDPMPVDWPGTLWLACSLICLVTAISLPIDRDSIYQPLTLLIAALLSAYGFFRHLGRAVSPLIRLQAVRGNSVFSSSLSSAFFVYAGNYTMVFLISLFLQYLMGLSPSQAGMVVLLQVLTIAIVSLGVARLSYLAPERILVALGCCFVSLGFFMLSFTGADTPLWLVAVALLLNGLGMGLFTTPNNNAALGSVDPERLSAATAILSLARYLGNMLGTAVVILLMSVLIGSAEIQPENYSALENVVRYAFWFACVSAAVASWLAYRAHGHTKGASG